MSSNDVLLQLLKYIQERDRNIENIYRMRNAAPVPMIQLQFGQELTTFSVLCRQFVEELVANGIIVFMARNRDNVITPHLTRHAAETWLADNPGASDGTTVIETKQLSLVVP